MKLVLYNRFLASLLVLFSFGIFFTAAGQSSKQPNIVLIYTDDQAYYTIHALGNTSNMDRLAKMGRA